jgi:hypothetical protein
MPPPMAIDFEVTKARLSTICATYQSFRMSKMLSTALVTGLCVSEHVVPPVIGDDRYR